MIKVKLIEYMKEHNISYYQLNKNKIVGFQTLNDIKNGKTNLTLNTLNKICDYLNCDISDIIEYIKE